MKLATVFTAIAIAASATAASADQLAKSAGVSAGVYADTTLVNIINARQGQDVAQLNFFLGQTLDSARVSSRGTSVDFASLIENAEQDNDTAQVASLKSLENGDNAQGGVDYAFLIDLAEQDNDTARVASFKSLANF